MNIMLLVSSMNRGGAERVASTLVNAWAARGDSVTLVATYTGRGVCEYTLSDQVRFIYLAERVRRERRDALQYGERLLALRAIVQETKPDVIVAFLTSVSVLTIVSTLGTGIPVIACEHINPASDGRSVTWDLICRWVYPLAGAITLLTEDAAATFAKVVPRAKILEVLPNPLPDVLWEHKRAATPPNARLRLVSVGRLCEQKQFDLLINVFAGLAREFPQWDLWIWGEGPDRSSLETLIASHGLQDRIRLPGTSATVWNEMLAAEAFVSSSRYEGLPMALMESMALGLPPVAFDCPSGPRELLRNGEVGLLVPADDARALTDALRRIMSDASLRKDLGQLAKAAVKERYSLGPILRIWDELFTRVGAQRR